MLKKFPKIKRRKIKIIGLTGGIGSGKSTVSRLFKKLGIAIIDADAISRNLTADNGKALAKILKVFGEEIFLQTQPFLRLNRDKLRQLVFDNENSKNNSNKKILENILHPLIFAEIKRNIKKNIKNLVEKFSKNQKNQNNQKNKNNPNYIILDVPLLYESPNIQKLCSKIISVECHKNIQIQRVKNRNGLNDEIIEKIINAQATPEQRSKIADFVIENNGTFKELKAKIAKLNKRL